MKSATRLFRQRSDSFRHAESRWSAFVHMTFIWMSKYGGEKLNVYQSKYSSNSKKWLTKNNSNPLLNLNDWTALNSIVDGQIKELFPKEPNFSISKPDITLINQSDNNTHITMIEVKTVGASVEDNINNYQDTVNRINALDAYTCDLYYLMSYGHEDSPKDWKLLEGVKANIILWEELFLKMKNSECPLLDYVTPLKKKDLDYWKDYLKKFNYILSSELKNVHNNTETFLQGKVEIVSVKSTMLEGVFIEEHFAIVNLKDSHGSVEIVISSDKLQQLREMNLNEDVVFKVNITDMDSDKKIDVLKIITLDEID